MNHKTCSKCKEVKPASSAFFHKDARQKSGFKATCCACVSIKTKAKYLLTAETQKKKGLQYYHANKEKCAANNKAYHDENKSVIAARKKQHQENNKAQYKASNSKYRTSKRKACPPWVNLKILQPFYCLAEELSIMTGQVYHIDHIDPLQHPLVCGLHVPANLQVLSQFDNISKHNKFKPYGVDRYGFTYELNLEQP